MLKHKKFWGIIFSLFFLWLALRKVDFQAVPEHLKNVSPLFLGLMLISYTFEHITRCFRWTSILSHREFPFKYSYFGLVLGFFINNLLPARAGEFFRAYYLSEKKVTDYGEAFASIVLERFFDGIMLMTMILLSIQRFSSHELLQKASTAATTFYAAVLAGLVLLNVKRELFLKIANWFLSFLPVKIETFLSKLLNTFINGLAIIKSPITMLKSLIISILCWTTSITTLWLCLQAFGFQEGFLTASFILTVLSISSMVPASPAGVGVYEFFCIFLMRDVLSYTGEQGAAFCFVMHGFQYFYVLIAGLIVMTIEGLSMEKLRVKS